MSIYLYLYTHAYTRGIEWLKKMCIYMYMYTYIYTYIYVYSGILAIKKKEIMPSVSTWVDLVMIILYRIFFCVKHQHESAIGIHMPLPLELPPVSICTLPL